MVTFEKMLKPLTCAVQVGHEWGAAQNRVDYGAGWSVLRTASQACGHCGSLRTVFITPSYSNWQPMTSAMRTRINTEYKCKGPASDPFNGPGI